MVDRIRELLSARQFTPTQFADIIGVARPIVSHILSGRNEPSLKVVQKIVDAFPEVSLVWLLKGAGSMTASDGAATPSGSVPPVARRPGPKALETARPVPVGVQYAPQSVAPGVAPAAVVSEGRPETAGPVAPAQDLAAMPAFAAPGAAASPEPRRIATAESAEAAAPGAPMPVASSPAPNETASMGAATNSASSGREPGSDSAVLSAATPFLMADKTIRRIVIFYQDGTFTDYQPENR